MERKLLVCFPHRPQKNGGPGTFQKIIEKELSICGHKVVNPESPLTPDVIIVVGGTRKLLWLHKCKKKGSRIIHRLDGINWRYGLDTVLHNSYLPVLRNWLMFYVRRFLADAVVYQSSFVKTWWYHKYGIPAKECREYIIHNGTDINLFSPIESSQKKDKKLSLLCVEGNISEDDVTLAVIREIASMMLELNAVINICGNMSDDCRNSLSGFPNLHCYGSVDRDRMPDVYRENNIFLSLEINAACPNAVIEAMSSGLPVVGFDTGALAELVEKETGEVVPYGGNPWRLEMPDIEKLFAAIKRVIDNRENYSNKARQLAEEKYSQEMLMKSYLNVIEEVYK